MIPIGSMASQVTQVGGVQVEVSGSPPPVVVTSVAPAVSSIDGGDTVVITGTGFIGGTPAVTFDGDAATSPVINDSETITCVIPAHAAGAINVVVTLTGGGAGTGTGVFTYQDPTASSITPATGSVDGGTAFTIAGTGFVRAGETITIQGTTATSIVRVSSIELTGVSPAGDAGAQDVVVSGDQTLAGAWTYSAWSYLSDTEPPDPGSGYVWADDFDDYSTIAARCSAYPANNRMTIPNPPDPPAWASVIAGRVGGYALRTAVPEGDSNRTWLSPFYTQNTNYGSRCFVMQFYFRISAGGSVGSYGTKWLEAWYPPNVKRMQTGLVDAGITFSDNGADAGSGTTSLNRTIQPVGPYICGTHAGETVLSDGDWHRFTFLWAMNTTSTFENGVGNTTSAQQDVNYTGTSSQDGRAAIWLDGTLVADFQQTKVGVTPDGGTGVWCLQCDVDSLMPRSYVTYHKFPDIFGYLGGSVPAPFTLDYDDLKTWAVTL